MLRDLVATTPGDEGKWFATAKEVGLFDEAIRLANQTPCDPKTLSPEPFAKARPDSNTGSNPVGPASREVLLKVGLIRAASTR
ncbi:MAG: hypothetical protein HY727_06015 [Candidatus Rokubacteria bacterium]|nr:hypothetical protein [Candidatus Rokubacteria bacterium]